MDAQKILETVIANYGGSGLVIGALIYALRTLWVDNKDLRARNDRLTDRFIVRDAISAVSPSLTSEIKK